MGQVIQFPKQKLGAPPQNMEEVLASVEASRRDHIEAFMEMYVPILFQTAYNEGFDLTIDDCNEINSLFVESFRAALLKSIGLHHELQDFAKDSIEMYLNELEEQEKET